MTSRDEIKEWFEHGVENNNTHMIVVCDTWNYEDFPVFCKNNINDKINNYESNKDYRVMEVYNLSLNMEEQLNEARCYNI